jgi:hypothetical protein
LLIATIGNADSPFCANTKPPDPQNTTFYLDIAASALILRKGTACAISTVQEPNFSLNTPSHIPMFTTKPLELPLSKIHPKARKAFQVDNIPHNLVALVTLVNAECSVYFHDRGFNIDINGKIIYKGWRVGKSNLFGISLTDDGT